MDDGAVTLLARREGMTNPRDNGVVLPHHRLVAFQVAVEFLSAVRVAAIRDASLRDQALRAAKSVCLNIAEGAGRKSRADKARVFAIARGEALEATAAVEIAAAAGDAGEDAAANCIRIAGRLVALLSGLIR
jgi:four helix bundle protein